jgi:hypothetical protein
MTTALTVASSRSAPAVNGDIYRMSTDAAGLCGELVKRTAMEIQGRRYVRVEGWQAIAIAHGCTASAGTVERIEGGVRAIGEVRRMSDGAVVATGEGFVGEDEATWFGGSVTAYGKTKTLPKRPDYAIRAMAQTRSISRACRSAFAHVVVLIDADLSTTPAEEVPLGGFDDAPQGFQGGAPAAEQAPPKSSAQAKRDGEWDRIKNGMDGCKTQADLEAWGRANAAAINALAPKWQAAAQDYYDACMDALGKPPADPQGLQIALPPSDNQVDWEDFLAQLATMIGGATTAAEVDEAQRVNGPGIERCARHVDDAVAQIAGMAEARKADLAARAA